VPSGELCYWLPVGFFEEILDRFAHLPSVRLTFDDGNSSDFEVAFPELTKRNLRAEFFVLAARIGQAGYLGPAQIRELVAAGMGIGLHGMAHRSWSRCNAAQLQVEIDDARRQIEAVTGQAVTRAACPFGAYNAPCLRKLRKSGFERVYTSDGGFSMADEWLQSRNTLQQVHQIEDVQSWVESLPFGTANLRRRVRTFVKSMRGGWWP
jgi:peptidoglycan/xylan/chitin deacetylase (PgdA/CDA1 family)